MKLKFYYDEFDYLAVETTKKYEPVEWVLTDNTNEYFILEDIFPALNEIKKNGGEWDMSFNKSYLTMTPEGALCGDLYDEDINLMLSLDKFKFILFEWHSFIINKKLKVKILNVNL